MRLLTLPLLAVCAAVVAAWPGAAYGDTMIDGGDVGGQVWTAAGSPYVVRGVQGHLRVPPDQELRMEPGTVVTFNDGFGSVTLQVEGTLTINGAPDAPVTLRGSMDGTAVEWQGIQPMTGTARIRISGAVVRHATRGVYLTRQADVQIDRTVFESCNYGLSVLSGTFAVDSVVARNNNVGIESSPRGTLTVTNSIAQNNRFHGMIAQGGGSLVIVNCTIDRNTRGIVGWSGSPSGTVAVHNTILANNMIAIEDDSGSALNAIVTVAHSTFWANPTNMVLTRRTPIFRALETEAPPGVGNVVADPLFVGPTDLHLRAGSSCIDSGIAASAPDHDLDQNPRPREGDSVADTDGSTFDRGAYEFVPGGGAGGAGGSGGTGGVGGSGGAAGVGGSGGTGGLGGSGGTGGVGGNTAGAAGAVTGGNPGGGSGGEAGSGSTGGSGGTAGGAATGGNSGGSAAGGSGGVTGGASGGGATDPGDGCGCTTGRSVSGSWSVVGFVFALGCLRIRRRRTLESSIDTMRDHKATK